MPPPSAVVESVLEEIDLEIVDPFGDDSTLYMSGTTPIPRPTPPPQHCSKGCIDEAYYQLKQNG